MDVLQGVSWSEERSREVDFSSAHTMVNHAVFIRSDSPAIHSFDQLRGREIAVHRDGIMHDTLRRQQFTDHLLLTSSLSRRSASIRATASPAEQPHPERTGGRRNGGLFAGPRAGYLAQEGVPARASLIFTASSCLVNGLLMKWTPGSRMPRWAMTLAV